MYCEMITCPALDMPMAINVSSIRISPPVDTAARPALPTYWPTTTMSTML